MLTKSEVLTKGAMEGVLAGICRSPDDIWAGAFTVGRASPATQVVSRIRWNDCTGTYGVAANLRLRQLRVLRGCTWHAFNCTYNTFDLH
jgi:hypothetical protein